MQWKENIAGTKTPPFANELSVPAVYTITTDRDSIYHTVLKDPYKHTWQFGGRPSNQTQKCPTNVVNWQTNSTLP